MIVCMISIGNASLAASNGPTCEPVRTFGTAASTAARMLPLRLAAPAAMSESMMFTPASSWSP